MKPFVRQAIKYTICCLLAGYLLLLLVAVFFSDRLILPGRRSYAQSPQLLRIEVAPGEYLSARYLTASKARYTILYCHGNGEDIGDLAEWLECYQRCGYNILAFDYRGYGTSVGPCSTTNALADARAAWNYLVNNLHIPPDRIILLGRSVGGAMAAHLAANQPAAGVILESTFTSVFRAVIPVSLVPFDKLKTIDLLDDIDEPILVIHGTADRLINCRHGRRLYQDARQPKYCLWVENAGHNNVPALAGEKYWQTLDNFVREIDHLRNK